MKKNSIAASEQHQHQMAFKLFTREVKTILNGVRSNPEFEEKMVHSFGLGMTPHQAVERFCENKNKELQGEILQLTNQPNEI